MTLGHMLTSTEAHGTLNTSILNDSDWFLNSKLASITIRPTTPDVIEPPFKLAVETPKVFKTFSLEYFNLQKSIFA